jgi:hypothetical protein
MNVNLVSLTKGFVLACDVLNLLNGINKIQESENNRWMHAAYLVNRIVILGCTFTHIGLELNGAKSETLEREKIIELIPRFTDVFVRFGRELALLEESGTPLNIQTLFRPFQKGILAPFSDLAITGIEFEAYNDKHYLDMTPEEFEKVRHKEFCDDNGNVYEYDISLEDCKLELEQAPKMLMAASLARFAFEACAINATANTCSSLIHYMRNFRRLANDLEAANNQAPPLPRRADANIPAIPPLQPPPVRRAAIPPANPIEEFSEDDIGLFVNLPFIPPPLYNDPLFKKFICPITTCPIRDPVGDPYTSTTLYEKSAILEWLSIRQVSPLTRIPLEPAQLIPKPALKNAIKHRLLYHQKKVLEYMESPEYQAILNAPLEEDLNLAIAQENPNVHS